MSNHAILESSDTTGSESTATATQDTSDSQTPSAPKDGAKRLSQPQRLSGKEEKKLIPPPPIIGPDGKELPRPRDASGRPLPIYLTADGKPVLDNSGAPIPLKFGEDGKPIPLDQRQMPTKPVGKSEPERTQPVQEVVAKPVQKVPSCVAWVAALDIVLTLCVTAYFGYKTSMAFQEDDMEKNYLVIAVVCLCLCALSGILAILAVQKNQSKFLFAWCGLAVILMLAFVFVCAMLPDFRRNSVFPAMIYSLVRIVWCLITGCCLGGDETNTSRSQYYIGGPVAQPGTVVVHQPAVVPAYGYGYGYPGYSYGDAALLGFAAGGLLGHHHYDPWGWGGGYYDGWGGGWGGGYGCDGGFGGYDSCGYGW